MLKKDSLFDLAIIGAGPAGMTAAIYAQRGNLKTVLFEKEAPGGQMVRTGKIENYPGFKTIMGWELSKNMLNQVKALGIIYKAEEVVELKLHSYPYEIFLKSKKENFFLAKTIIFATGTKERKLVVEGEEEYFNRGVSTCAICDGAFYDGTSLPIIVVGGGYTAFETALFVERYTTNNVFLVHRRSEFRAGKNLVERAKVSKKIKILTDTVVLKIKGDEEKATTIEVQNLLTSEKKTIPIAVVFLNIGAVPETCLAKKNKKIKINQDKYFVAKQNQKTSLKGVFVAGDVVEKKLRQIVTATSDGAIAAQEAINFLGSQDQKTN